MLNCFLCGARSPFSSNTCSARNQEHSKAKFVLKILLELGDEFDKHLSGESFEKWWSTCVNCDCIITQSFVIYQKLVEVSDKFRESQKQFVEKYKRLSCISKEDAVGDSCKVSRNCYETLKKRNWETNGYSVPHLASFPDDNDMLHVKEEVKVEDETTSEGERENSSEEEEEDQEPISVSDSQNEEVKTRSDEEDKTPRTRARVQQSPNVEPIKKRTRVLPNIELNPSTNKYHCPSCPYTSSWKHAVRQHFRLGRHKGPPKPKPIKKPAPGPVLPDLTLNPSTKKFHCPVCPYSSRVKYSLRQHYKLGRHIVPKSPPVKPTESLENPVKIKKGTNKPAALPNLERNPSTNKFHCPSCDYSQGKKMQVRLHYRRVHLRTLFFTCTWEGCGRTFSNRGNFYGHMDKHKGTPRFQCSQCPLSFYTYNPLVRHTQAEHEGGRNGKHFICNQCGKGYPTRDYLNIHKAKHRNIGKPSSQSSTMKEEVICDLCGKTLKRGSLWLHNKTCHKGLPVSTKYICPECQNPFISQETLGIHLYAKHKIGDPTISKKRRLELKWHCDVTGCRLKFKHEEKYKAHMDDAHGPDKMKPGKLECKYCGQRFFLQNKHKQHETVHENAESKPYRCDQCGKGFPTTAHLRYHMRNTHKMVLENIQGFRPGSTFNKSASTESN